MKIIQQMMLKTQLKKKKMENRKVVFNTNQEHLANLVKDQLSNAGIDVLMLDKHDSISEVVGGFELHVLEEDVEKATQIVNEHNS